MSPQRLFALILGPVMLSAAATPGFAGDLVEIPLAQPGAPELGLELRKQLAQRYSELGPDYRPRTRNLREDGSPLYTNRLLLEASPYLQQHAHNPVNWYPWGDEAFAAAKRLGRPVLVSIGYSTCHWCHVMEEESFDDPETAKHLNERFIAIKVDREARPDVDDVYMAAVHAMGIRGGWPLNVFVTPDRRPFYGGTYFPPRGRGGRPGFREILTMISEQYAENPSRTSEQADRVTAAVVQRLEGASAIESRIPNADSIAKAARVYERNADRQWGGTGTQPKFPSSLPTRLLLRYERRTGDREALAIATLSLEKMAEGGIRDHVGGGFHRYSTDQRWLVPHFEKMLYDNALLAQDYLEAWQRLGRADFAAMTREILDYVAREMTAPEGGFYSATDADSLAPDGEMEEGWFFTWTPAEIRQALTPERAKELELYYRVSSRGDYEGRNIFHTRESLESVAATLGIEPEVLRRNLDTSRASLYQVRSRREPPLRDEKVLVAWNGLMISAFARAGFAFDEPRYVESARRAADFILTRMRDDDGRLIRVFKDGRAAGPSFLDDHAFFIKALLDLYEADPGPRWLAEAIALQRLLDEHYRDDAGGGYFASADDGEMLIVREKPGRDGAVPSGNSIEALNLLRLYEFTTDLQYAQSAELLFSAFHDDLSAGGAGLSEMLIALDFQLDTPKEIVIVAPASGEGLAEMLAPLRRTFLPNRIVSVATEGKDLDAQARYAPLLKNKPARRGRTTAYVCEDRVCALPTESPAEFEKQISQLSRDAGKPSGGNGAGR